MEYSVILLTERVSRSLDYLILSFPHVLSCLTVAKYVYYFLIFFLPVHLYIQNSKQSNADSVTFFYSCELLRTFNIVLQQLSPVVSMMAEREDQLLIDFTAGFALSATRNRLA